MQDPKTKRAIHESDVTGLVTEVTRGTITRRQFVVRAAALGLSTGAIGSLLAACGKKKPSPTSSGTGAGVTYPSEAPGKLSLYNWADYMSPKAKKDFQNEYGIEVVETYYDSNEELLAKLKAGATGYDVIVPSDYMVSIMIKTGLLMPLDMALLPNFKNCEPFLQNPEFDPGVDGPDGKKYSVPYMFGTTGIGVRVDKYTGEVTGWEPMFDPANKGKIVMLNDERETPGVALKSLGYSLNSTDDAQIEEAKNKLIEQKPLVVKYDSNPNRVLAAGNPLTHCWDGDVIMAGNNVGMDVLKYVFPSQGYAVWADGLAIPVGAKSPYGAHLFMNYLMDTDVAVECANYTGYQTGIATAAPLVKSEAQKSLRPTAERMKAAEFFKDLGEYGRKSTEMWTEVKSA